MFVYVLKSLHLHKIGVARNIDKRLGHLRVGNPFGIKVIQQYETKRATTVEAILHSHFNDKRISGEWFDLSDDNLLEIPALVEKWSKPTYFDMPYPSAEILA